MTAFLPLLLLFAAEALSEDGSATTSYCGIKRSEDQFPWSAVLYRKEKEENTFLCGGTVISKRLVLTAAHCFLQQKNVNPADLLVAVGVIHASWSRRDPNEQRFEAQSITVADNFRGPETKYQNDIAVVTLNGSISVSPCVMPPCLRLNAPFNITETDVGTMPAWNDLLSDSKHELHEVKLNYDAFKNCHSRVNVTFKPYIQVADKICATTNEELRGNSGTGLTFPRNIEAGKTAHFLEGILTISDLNSNVGFTNITAHGKLIEKVVKTVGDTLNISPDKTECQPLPL